ncbi:unnamed protein product [Closterium sp. NIES-53]
MLGEGEQRSFMVVYVDDILIFSPSSDLVKEVMLKVQDRFKCKALGDVSFYLRLQIERDVEKWCMWVHQRKYLEALAANFGQSEGHVATPFPSGFKCVKGPEEERRRFHSLVGSLMYAAVNTRPDVAFATGQLARVVQCPNEEQGPAPPDLPRPVYQSPSCCTTGARLLLTLATTSASTLRGCTSTSTTAAATSTTAAAASTTSAAASTTSTAATEAPTPGATPTSTATPSSATTPPAAPSTTSAPLSLAVAASPTRSRRSLDLLSANEVDSSSRSNRGEKGDRGTLLKEGGATVAARSTYS